MENGLYSLSVTIGPVITKGIVVIRDKCINGGDTERIYQGAFEQQGTRICGEFKVSRWDTDIAGIPRGVQPVAPVEVTLTGRSDSSGFHLVGKGRHSAIVEVSGRLIAPLVEPCRIEPEEVHEISLTSVQRT